MAVLHHNDAKIIWGEIIDHSVKTFDVFVEDIPVVTNLSKNFRLYFAEL